MQVFATLVDYLEESPLSLEGDAIPPLRGCDRPIMVFEPDEKITQSYRFLIKRDSRIYEVGFPWVQRSDWDTHQDLLQQVTFSFQDSQQYKLFLHDEVFDESQLSSGDEEAAKQLQAELGSFCDRSTAETIALFIGLFRAMFGGGQGSKKEYLLVNIPSILNELSQSDARLPLVLALNRRYELRHKLELIAPKLRSQLNRVAEMMPLGHIQELDAYCLRDYIRRPGRDAIEKAGSRQELMAIQRYQNFNTPENRFLKGFCNLLHLECHDYRDYPEARTLERAINQFRQEPTVQTITTSVAFAGKPNYVLQQNPIYRSFYQAYLDYVKQRSDKEKIWGYRQALLVDVVVIYLVAALLQMQGSFVSPLSCLEVKGTPDDGRYLPGLDHPLIVQCILRRVIWTFQLTRSSNPKISDIVLTAKQQSLGKTTEQSHQLLIWVFWYKPSPHLIERLYSASDTDSRLSMYLFDRPTQQPAQDPPMVNSSQLRQIPAPLEKGFIEGVSHLNQFLCQWLGAYSQ
jgi:hypothetical protein